MSGLGLDGALLAAAEAPAESSSAGWVFLAVLAVVVLPFVLGRLLANLLKLRDMGFRISLVILSIVLGFAPFVAQYTKGPADEALYRQKLATWEAEGKAKGEPPPKKPEPRTWKSAIKLGIDLEGGTNLVFQAIESTDKKITPDIMAQMVTAVSRRINPTGTEEVVVRAVGKDRIEVIVPGANQEEVARIKRDITRLGSLEFAILANRSDHRDLIARAQGAKRDVRGADGRVIASWREVAYDKDGKPKYEPGPEIESRVVEKNGKKITEVLVVLDPEDRRVTGKYLTRASETSDEGGNPAVAFSFNSSGANLFMRLTSSNLPRADGSYRLLAILLDEKIQSAPRINSTISDSGIITGRFTREEVNELIGVLKAGALVVPLNPEPVSEFSVGPLLAHDVQEKGMMAVYLSSILVFVFMLVYYFFAGFVADVCLAMNIVLILGSMAYIDATFTLPGIAGIVLTIGMAVDANVLIYERMREEQAKGASLRMTIQNGFDRALSAIVDSNVTTLITAVILYMIGTDQIKGFAVTLFIGLTASMFTAVYMGRVFFEIAERKRWLKRLKMMALIRVPNIDWIRWCGPAVALSAVVILAGFIALGIRGVDNLDIDFTGGTMLTMEFQKPEELKKVQSVLQEDPRLGSTTSVERLLILGDKEQQSKSDEGRRFRVRTKLQDDKEKGINVGQIVNDLLANAGMPLRRVTMDYGKIIDLAAAKTDGEKTDKKDGDKPAEKATDESKLSEFPNGREVELSFSDGMSPSTVADLLVHALSEELKPDGTPKYEQPRALFALEGIEREKTAGTPQSNAAAAAEGYVKFRLNVSPDLPEKDLEAALASIKTRMATEPTFSEVSTFDSSVAVEMQEAALLAVLFSIIAIVAYIWFRFERVNWGLAAVAALAHDVLVTVGMIPLAAYLSQTAFGRALLFEDFKINLGVVASVLTIMGYSLNDTIVIFDRIREIRGKNPHLTAEMLNLAVNQTLSRTILTSFTVFITVIIMYTVGGEGLHGFAFTMLVGVISGTWSTIYMSNPALLWLMRRSGDAKPSTPSAVPAAMPGSAATAR